MEINAEFLSWIATIGMALAALVGFVYKNIITKNNKRKGESKVSHIYPYTLDRLEIKINVDANGNAKYKKIMHVNSNEILAYIELFLTDGNSNSSIRNNVLPLISVDGETIYNIGILEIGKGIVRYKVPIPESSRHKLFNLISELELPNYYPCSVSDIQKEKSKSQGKLERNSYVAEGVSVWVPTKKLILSIQFSNGYPAHNFTNHNLLGSSSHELASDRDSDIVFTSEITDKGQLTSLSVDNPAVGTTQVIRWLVSIN